MGFNRLAFGDRFKSIFPSHDPVYYSRLGLGASATTQNEPGTSTQLKRNEAQIDFSMDYGLPGKPGYTYKRPFDYSQQRSLPPAQTVRKHPPGGGITEGSMDSAPTTGLWGLTAATTHRAQSSGIGRRLSLGTTDQWGDDALAAGRGAFARDTQGRQTLHGTSARYH